MREMTIDGETVVFVRADGTLAEHSVGIGGKDENGNLMFFEIMDDLRPVIEGKAKYKRIIIRRVFPAIKKPINE